MMRARSMLLSTVLCGGVLFLSAGSSAAASGTPLIKPEGAWAVTKVEVKHPGTTPYCALARRFGNGSVVTFARNAQEETSVAFDFPPNTFQTGQDYTIVLDPGSGESRSYKAQPVSERGIVIRMGRDRDFYGALEENGKLGVLINDKNYVFSMPDLLKGEKDLASCLGVAFSKPSLPVAPASAEAAVPSVQAPVKQASANDIQSLQEENTRLRNALESERKIYEDRMQQDSGSPTVADLNEKLRLLQKKNAELKSQIASPDGHTFTVKTDDKDIETLKNLRAEVAQLKAGLAEQKQRIALAPITASAKTLAAAKAENEKLQAKIESDQDKLATQKKIAAPVPAPDNSAELGALQTENAQLKADIEAQKQKIATLQESSLKDANKPSGDMAANVAALGHVKGLEAQLDQLKAENKKLADQITALNTVGGTKVKISSANWNLERATERYNQAEKEVSRLGGVVEQERAKCTVDKKNLEYMLFDPKIATKAQIAKLLKLEGELAEAKKAAQDGNKEELASAAKNVSVLKTQLASANDQIATLKQDLGDAHAAKAASEDQSTMVVALKQEIASLNKQIDDMQVEKAESVTRHVVSAEPLAVRTPAPQQDVPDVEVNTAMLAHPVAASKQPVPILPPPSSADKPLPPTAAPVRAVADLVPPAKLMSLADVKMLLSRAGVKPAGGVQAVSSGASQVSYRWKDNGLFGSAEQKPIQNPAQYDGFVKAYLGMTKSRCKGQFAAIPEQAPDAAPGAHLSVYGIACVDEKTGEGSAAALAFYGRNGTFTTIASETAADSMDLAMDARDKIVGALGEGKLASR